MLFGRPGLAFLYFHPVYGSFTTLMVFGEL
jgi:hypothetical protein